THPLRARPRSHARSRARTRKLAPFAAFRPALACAHVAASFGNFRGLRGCECCRRGRLHGSCAAEDGAMTAISSLNRKFLIAGAAILTMGAGAFTLVLFDPALGPIAGTISPQLYVDSVVGAQIPVHGRFVLV